MYPQTKTVNLGGVVVHGRPWRYGNSMVWRNIGLWDDIVYDDDIDKGVCMRIIPHIIYGNYIIIYGYGSKLGTPKLWMVNTKLD